ncbi:MAG TPA: sulfatase-like hydrolase/transferase, partial [Solirubrobacteraceae bacterium]|nr:sulfatase-like hydrolase/transferase [Solirubrobacteraceae bacterium]
MPGSTVGFRRAALHLGALWALAFVQPMFGLLGDRAGAEFFVARGNTTFDILVFAFGYAFVPPLLGATLVWAVGRIRPGLSWGLHLTLVALLVAALVLPPLGDALGGSAISVVAALAVGAGGAFLYTRVAGVRTFLTVLAVAPLVFLVLFLVFSPIADLLTTGEASASSKVDGPARSSTPIVHIVLDELPISTLVGADGRIDAQLYPNIAKLAAGATWYPHATTVADSTPEAVPAQATGVRPKVGDLPTTASHPHSIFTLFARSHEFAVAEPITDVCPADLCAEDRAPVRARLSALAKDLKIVAGHLLLPDDISEHLPAIDRGWLGFGSGSGEIGGMTAQGSRDKLIGRVIERIDADDARTEFAHVEDILEHPKTSRPPMVFMHSTLPHGPPRFLADGHGYIANRGNYPGMKDNVWVGPQWLVDNGFERHVLQTMYTDKLVGVLLDTLRERGIYDKAAIVLTADHGISFTTGQPRRRIRPGNINEISLVPFIVKLPGQKKGAVDDRPVYTVDALPTLAKAAGVKVPWKTDGMPVDERPTTQDADVQLYDNGKLGDHYPLSTVLAQYRKRQAYETRILRAGPYGIGPRPDLLGTQVANSAPVPDSPTATVDAAGSYDDVDKDADALPNLITGDVDKLPANAPLAIAVNGRVEATTRVWVDDDQPQYVAFVPPESLRDGSNTITIL